MQPGADPFISVCMAAYNGEKYIAAQLLSILKQLPATAEVIVADNQSTDHTVEVVTGLKDPRIRVVINSETKGPIANFGFALSHAKGDIIFLADQDDIWMDGKVEASLEQLKTADLVLTDCTITDSNLSVINESYFRLTGSKKGLVSNLLKNSYLGCCMAFRKNLLDVAIPFPAKIPMHDIWIGFAGELLFKTAFIHKPYVYYRRHGGNHSSTSDASPFGFMQKMAFRFNTLRYIPLLLLRKLKKDRQGIIAHW